MACADAEPAQTTTAEIPPASAVARSCNADASRDWSAVGSQYFIIEAEAHGAACADAVATIRIRSLEGAVLFAHDYPVRDVPLAFNPGNDQTGLRAELDVWTQNTSETQRTDELPAWPASAQHPPNFLPLVSRHAYEAARGAQGALFCFPDGAESNACVAVAGETATLLGSRTPEQG
jgi:hypothetical protein